MVMYVGRCTFIDGDKAERQEKEFYHDWLPSLDRRNPENEERKIRQKFLSITRDYRLLIALYPVCRLRGKDFFAGADGRAAERRPARFHRRRLPRRFGYLITKGTVLRRRRSVPAI